MPIQGGQGGVNADPKFVDPAAGDFHLAAGSPAIGAGVAIGGLSDHDGVSRPQAAAVDIGAYQWVP